MKPQTKIIIAVSLPIVLILIVLGSVLIPKWSFTPKYDFVYGVGGTCSNTATPRYVDYPCRSNSGSTDWYPYKVVDGTLVKETTLPSVDMYDENQKTYVAKPLQVTTYPSLYRYSVKNNTFTKITLEEAAKLKLTSDGSAPDGTVVTTGDYRGNGIMGMFFGGSSSSNGYYLKNGAYSTKIVIKNGDDNSYYYSPQDFHLVGWIIQ